MASPQIDRMDKAQRRRLMATLLASAIAGGRLNAGAVDLAGLLFGDPDLWTDFQEHGAIVEEVIATSPSPVAPTHDRLVGKALQTAMQLIEDHVVGALKIQDAQRRNGSGKSGDDTEYRRLRAKLKNYAMYLAERSEYERLNRSLRNAYARAQMDQMAPADLVKEFSLPLVDVAMCLDEVEALLAIHSSSGSVVDPRSFVPRTKTGAARKKLVLLDAAGRPRWGRGKAVGSRRSVKGPTDSTSASFVGQAASEAEIVDAIPPERDSGRHTLAQAAILHAHLGLKLHADEKEALPDDWRTAKLTVSEIVQLLPYPRPRRLETALAAFGYPTLQECIQYDPALLIALEEQAKAQRRLLLKKANMEQPCPRFTGVTIDHRWWRAVRFYEDCQRLSASDRANDQWPEPWEYISAARPDTYSERARRGVREIIAIVEIARALRGRPADDWPSVLTQLRERDGVYLKLVPDSDKFLGLDKLLHSLIYSWIEEWESLPIEELPGFRGEEEASTPLT